MAGEISPDIMFWEDRKKVTRMGTDVYRSVRMGADGCITKEGSKNKTKRAPNGRSGHVFECMVTAKNSRKLAGMVVVIREDPLGGMSVKKGARVNPMCIAKPQKAKHM